MRSNSLQATMKTAIFALCILLLAGIAYGQQQVNLTAAPASAYLPNGSTVPMWGYSCGAAVANSTATCASLNPGTTGWSPVIITVPTTQGLTINLTNNLPSPVPTSLTIVGQIGGGLGDITQRTTSAAPIHDNMPTTWTAANAGGVFTPPAQGPRVQSFSTEVATGVTASLTWTAPRAGTYLLESGTHPSIQGPMGLYGIVVVTDAAGGNAYPNVKYTADVPVLLSEIDPVQNAAVQKAVNTPGFSESAVSGPWENGPVVSINITNGGSGYITAPGVTLKSNPDGHGAASAVIDTDPNSPTFGQVVQINIDNAGGYNVAPQVIIDDPPTGHANVATAVAALQLNTNALAHCSGGAAACYPPAVNYTPLYYLINGTAFDKNNASASLITATATSGTATSASNTVSGGVLVRLVNAGLRMHVPSIVGSVTTTGSGGMALIAEDGNPLPGLTRVQSEVFMAAGKTYDVMIKAPAASGNALPIFDRELSLSGNASSHDTGMLAYLAVNGASLPTDGAFATSAAVARDDSYSSLIAGKTLTISDASKGLIANDTNVYGVHVLAGPTGGQLTLNVNGTFTYVPNAGTTSDSFTYCANGTVDLTKTQPCSSGLTATVTLGAATIEANTGITVNDDAYNSSLGHSLLVRAPGVLVNDADAAGYPLALDVASISASAGLTITADPSGAFTATLASTAAPGAYTFTYKARNSQGTQSASAATVTINFPKPSGLAVSLVDGMTKTPLPGSPQDYRWVIEEDRTFYVDPQIALAGNHSTTGGNSINSFGTAFHTSYMPLVAQGCTGDKSCELGQTVLDNDPSSPTYGQHVNAVCDIGSGICRAATANSATKTRVLPSDVYLDTTKRYYLSVLPGDADDPTIDGSKSGHAMGGSEIVWNGTAWVTNPNPNGQIILQPTPLPPAQVSAFVYEDDFPLNGENDSGGGIDILAPNEPGLSSFNITIFDDVGGSGDSVGQLTYDMFNEPLSNGLAGTKDPLTGADACPISQQVTDSVTNGDGSQKGITGVIPVCPKFESDGKTLSPLAGQVVVKNLPPGRYGIVATPGADRIARGEEWLQTNTLDGQKAHDSFIRASEPSYFQEFGPAAWHVAIGFANPAIINGRHASVCAGITASNPTNTCTHTVSGKITGVHMSRTPDERLYSSGSRDMYAFTQCFVSLGSPDGADFAFAKCDGDGNFTLPGIPNGDWRISVFDQWNDQIIDGYATPLTVSGSDLNMGDVAVHQWKANVYTRTFIDVNGDGKSQDNEPGLPFVITNVRYRDGSYSNLNSTDLNGYAAYNEVFPLFNWYVIEDDTTRYKNTGTHVVYDVGGPIDSPACTPGAGSSCNSTNINISQNLASTHELFPLPLDLRFPGSIYCKDADCSNESIQQSLYYNPSSGTNGDPAAASSGRIDPPYVEFYGWQGFAGQGNFLEFGKKPFKEAANGQPAENGGIRGDVVYASTRPFDDPALDLQNFWEPQVPQVTINLYQEGTAPDGTTSLKLVDSTQTSSWDDWAQGFRSNGVPNMNCPGQDPKDPFYFTIKGQQVNGEQLPHDSQYKCYDGMHNWNQLQPAPYDGYYKFPSVTARDPQTGRPTGTNCNSCIPNPDDGFPMLPSGKYVVEMIVPQGYELVKEEDKNLLNGDVYTAPATVQIAGFGNIFIMPDQAAVGASYNPTNAQNSTTDLGRNPINENEGDTGSVEEFWPCVGEARVVPDFLSIYPQQQLVAPFAGAVRNLCDRKEVRLEDQRSALVKFYVFTSAHVAAHLTGIISDDLTAEFDPFAPAFGEKFSPPNLPVSIKDWAGNEINRVYSDQWGIYDGLTYSTWGVNPPDPSGFVPQVMVTCMNDRGTGQTPDPLYNPGYSQFCYELTFMPGVTFYADTPVVQTTAFADQYNHPDCNYPDATPAVKEVHSNASVGPWAPGSSSVASLSLGNGGSGYTGRPSVSISGGGGSGATGSVTMKVSGINVTNAGTNYTSRPNVSITGGGGSGATVNNGGVTLKVVSVSFTGTPTCTSTPNVRFSGNGGASATATWNSTTHRLTAITVNSGGSYTGVPNVSFNGGNCTTTTLTAHMGVNSINLSNDGSGYTSDPTVTISGGGGSGATATATMSVNAITLTNGGSGYSSVPTVSITGAGGSGATATAALGPVMPVAGSTLTMTALGDQSVDNNAFSGPAATTAPFNNRTITRHYNFGTTQGTVTIGGKNAPVTHWDQNSITVQVPAGVPACARQQQAQYGGSPALCGELVITNANGQQSIDAVTITIGGKAPTVLASGQSVQSAIDQAAPGDLIIVPAGYYSEMLIMWKPVRLQGVGAPSAIINGDPHPSGKLDPWRQQVNCLFGLAINGQPYTGNGANGGSNPYDATYDPVAGTGSSCPGTGWVAFNGQPVDPSKPGSGVPQVDRIPLEGIVGWDTTVNGNLAQLLQEPSLMGAYEGAAITVLAKGVDTHGQTDPYGQLNGTAGGFPTGTTLLKTVPGLTDSTGAYPYIDHCNEVPNPFPSNFECNPSSIDGLMLTNSSQGGGGIFIHGWAHNIQVANNRVQNNFGTLTGGITVGQGETPDAYLQGDTQLDPWSCTNDPTLPAGTQLPFCLDTNVNVHNNYISQNASDGDELFSATPAGAGGATICTGLSQRISPARPALVEEAWIQKSAANCFRVICRHTAGAYNVIPFTNLRGHILHDLFRFLFFQEKASMLRQNVFGIGITAVVPAFHGQITAILCDYRRRSQIIGRRQLPVLVLSDHRVVTRMIIEVRDHRIEARAPEELLCVFLGFGRDSAQFFNQKYIRPICSQIRGFFRPQNGQATYHACAQIPLFRFFAVEAFDQQNIFSPNSIHAAFSHLDPTLTRQAQHRVFYPGVVPAIIRPIEFRNPKLIVIFDNRLRPGATHRSSEEQQLLDLGSCRIVRQFVLNKRFG